MQVKENVNAVNFLTVGNLAGKGSGSQKEQTEQSDFASFLSPSVDNSGTAAAGVIQKDKSSKLSKTEASSKDKAWEQKNVNTNKDSVQTAKQNGESDPVKNSDGKELVSGENEAAIPEEAVGKEAVTESGMTVEKDNTDAPLENITALSEILGSILQQVMEQFELTADDLSEKLDEFGMEMPDLLTEDGVKEFFLSMNKAEVSDLIVDEELNQEWNQFFDGITEDFEKAGPEMDELIAFAQSEEAAGLLDEVPLDTENRSKHVMDEFAKPDGMAAADIKTEEPVVIVSDERSTDARQEHSAKQEEANTQETGQQVLESEILTEKKGAASERKAEPRFENPILQAVKEAVDVVQEVPLQEEAPISGREVIDQIVEQVKVNMNQNTTSLEMQLYPEHLGKIQIHIISKDGVMTARIAAETEAAKQAIEGGLASLKETMEHQDLKVEAIEVMVSTTGFERGNEEQNSYEQQQNRRTGKRLDLSDLEDEESTEETAEIERMKYTGSSVSYTA